MSRSRIDEAFEHVTELGRAANVYFASQEPWKLMSKAVPKGKLHIFPHYRTKPKHYSKCICSSHYYSQLPLTDEASGRRVEMILYHCIEAVRACALCLQCIVPTSASRLLDQIAVPATQRAPLTYCRFGWRPAVIGGDVPLNAEAGNVNGMWEGMDHVAVGRAAVREAPFAKLAMEEEKIQAEKERIAAERKEQAAKAKAIAAAAKGEPLDGVEVSKRQLKKLAKKEAKLQRKAEAKAEAAAGAEDAHA